MTKNQILACRLDSAFVDKLDEYWRSSTYPNPDNLSEDIHFRSRAEFVEFVLKAIVNMDELSWSFFARWFRSTK